MTDHTYLAAQGPSGAAGSNSTFPKWLKITGIGCAVICLVVTVLMALGVFQAVSCCTDTHRAGIQAQSTGFEFANALHDGDYDAAYELLAESKKEETSRAEFEQAFAPHESMWTARGPYPVRYEPHVEGRENQEPQLGDLNDLQRRWRVGTAFAAEDGSEALNLQLAIEFDEDGGEELSGGITDWEIQSASWNPAETVYGQTALRFHERLERRNFTDARLRLAPDSELGGMQEEAFVEELRPVFERFDEMEDVRVHSLHSIGDPNALRVEMRMTDAEGGVYAVDYVVDWGDLVHDVSEVRRIGSAESISDDEGEEPAGEETDEEPGEEGDENEDGEVMDDDGEASDDG